MAEVVRGLRPGRAVRWRDVYAWVFPWGFSFKRGPFMLFVRVGPAPYVNLILRALGAQVSVSTAAGYIADAELRRVRYLWGGEHGR